MNINIDIEKDINNILMPFLAVNSETATHGEKKCEKFLVGYLEGIEYFKENPEHFGRYSIDGDHLRRHVTWAMLKGEGSKTVVLIHHNDVVGVEDFKTLHHVAHNPLKLEKELLKIADELPSEAREDLQSGDYLFGRGAADMKGGGAIQLALLKRYSEQKDFKGNVIVLSLPDEENLSAGMRAAVNLLDELKSKYSLNYVHVINSEPHQRKSNNHGLISEGSVGKIMAFVYVRGYLAHVGKVFEGLNPVSVLSEIVDHTELVHKFSDSVGGETSPPPTWLYMRDRKTSYDVSMPLGAAGCVSFLTLDSNPATVLSNLKDVSEHAFDSVIARMNIRYQEFCKSMDRKAERLPWEATIVTFTELVKEAFSNKGKVFSKEYNEKLKEINKRISLGETDLIESTFELTEFVYNYITDLSPRVVLGLVPPYYPNVSNLILDDRSEKAKGLFDELSDYSIQQSGTKYDREYYYTGISDLSYFALKDSKVIEDELKNNMPLYGAAYNIPLSKIEGLSMPCMNIGPWGKDFHKMTERVYKKDLYENTPALIDRAIKILLNQEI